MKKSNRRCIPLGISFPPALLKAARQRAAEDHRTISGYVQGLIYRDLARCDMVRPDADQQKSA